MGHQTQLNKGVCSVPQNVIKLKLKTSGIQSDII